MHRSGGKAAVMKDDKNDGKRSELVIFEAHSASKREKPNELPPAPYFV
jgi:hypothetical protein